MDEKTKTNMYLTGYLAKLTANHQTQICFVSGESDCLTISEIIQASGHNPVSFLNKRLLITIEDEA